MTIYFREAPAPTRWGRFGRIFSALSLLHQFLLLSSLLVTIGLGILGYWVSDRIEDTVKADVGVRAALYMENFLAPQVQELLYRDTLSEQSRLAIDRALARDAARLNVVEAVIWTPEGRVLYSTVDHRLVGHSFPMTADILKAAAGEISVDFDALPHADAEMEVAWREPSFEIYMPIHSNETGRVIAISEFYQDAAVVVEAVRAARGETWAVTGLVSFGLIAGLYFVVSRGSRLIDQQRNALDQRVAELTALLDQNRELHRRVEDASQRSVANFEVFMRRIGSDLHDGIGQLLTFVLLRLEKLFPGDVSKDPEYRTIKGMLDDAMTEIRHMSAGLTLPQIEAMPLEDAIASVVRRYEEQTTTSVDLTVLPGVAEPAYAIRIAVCRMVQEALSNCFKHADGLGQQVRVDWQGREVRVEVRDAGPGLPLTAEPGPPPKRQPLGLVGMRSRIESLGGRLRVDAAPCGGTRLTACIPLRTEGRKI